MTELPVEKIVTDFIGLKASAPDICTVIDQYAGVLRLPGFNVHSDGDFPVLSTAFENVGLDDIAVR